MQIGEQLSSRSLMQGLFVPNNVCDMEHVIKSFPERILQGDQPLIASLSSCSVHSHQKSKAPTESVFQQNKGRLQIVYVALLDMVTYAKLAHFMSTLQSREQGLNKTLHREGYKFEDLPI